MNDDHKSASGWFDHHGWWINTGSAEPASVLLASAHESNHRQLEHSTTFGAVTLTMHRLAVVTGDADRRRVVAGLVRCSFARPARRTCGAQQ